MQNPVKAVQQHIHNNPRPYLIASAVTGVVVGVVVTKKLSAPVAPDIAFPIATWIETLETAGQNVYVLPKAMHEAIEQVVENFSFVQ